MKRIPFVKKIRYLLRVLAKRFGFLRTLKSISKEKYDEKVSASLLYGLLSAIAVNFFYQSGHVYSSGATGIAQIISTLSGKLFGFVIPISVIFYLINIPLLFLAWRQIGHKFTVFTFITVTISSLFIHFLPQVTLTTDPLINAIFGGLFMGTGIGFALKSNISSGGTDIVSLTVRRKTGRSVGNISMIVNGVILVIAGLLFGWQSALYSLVAIFICTRVTDGIYTKQKRMQAIIITSNGEKVIRMIHKRLHHGVTCINDAEGTYTHEKKSVLLTVITRAEFNDFKYYMKKTDPTAFVSVSENVQIIGRFVETDGI